MHFATIFRILGTILRYFSFLLIIPLLIALVCEWFPEITALPQPRTSIGFFLTILISWIFSLVCLFFSKRKDEAILSRRDSILLVCMLWFGVAALGALPFIFSKVLQNPLDAYFEAMSALTTTGASILYPQAFDPLTGKELSFTFNDTLNPLVTYTFFGTVVPLRDPVTGAIVSQGIAALGHAMLFWHAFLQWIGGLGIVVMALSILPAFSIGGKRLFETERSGPNKEGIVPRIKETVNLLWKTYLCLTVLQVLLLLLTSRELSLLEALMITFSTISTGGLLTVKGGLATYHNTSTMFVILIFMICGSVNFSLYFHVLKGRIYKLYSSELAWFFVTLLCGCILMSVILWKLPAVHSSNSVSFTFPEAIKYGSLQAVSAQTTTGFLVLSYDQWPFAAQGLMLMLLFIGGMAGSTSGGLKILRCIMGIKLIVYRIKNFFYPNETRVVKVENKEISDNVGMNVFSFFVIVVLCTLLGSFILVLDGIAPMTALATTSSMLNNAGLAFGGIGSANSVVFFSPLAKICSILWMVMGRLEFFSLIALIFPSFWSNK